MNHSIIHIFEIGPSYAVTKFLPIIVLDQLSNRLIRKHLPYPMKRLSMELKGLFKQHFIFNTPLIRKRRKISQILHCTVQIMLMPKQHSKGLFSIVSILFFGNLNVFIHCKAKNSVKSQYLSFSRVFLMKSKILTF